MSDNKPTINIRATEPEDLDSLYEIENDTEIWNVGTTNVPYSRYVLHDYIANTKNDIYTDRQARLMIEDGQHNTVGIVDLINFDPKNQKAEIGIVIKKKYRNRGFALAALTKIKKYSLSVLHLHQIYACVNSNNKQSLQLFEKCGFSKSATLKDWLFDGKKYHDAILMQLFL